MLKRVFRELGMVGVVGLIAVLMLSLIPMMDRDFGWHLRTGEYIVENLSVPRADLFSYSAPDHEYIAHSWLSDVIIYQLYSLFGLWGVNLFYSVIIVVGMWFLVKVLDVELKRKELAWIVVALLPYLLIFTGLRTLLVSFVFMCWLLWELVSNDDLNIKKKLKILLGFLLWVNLHGGFVMGLGLLALWIVAIVGETVVEKKTVDTVWLKSMLLLFVGAALVALINPYGMKVYQFVFDLLSNSAAGAMNVDWVPLLSGRLGSNSLGMRMSVVVLSLALVLGINEKIKWRIMITALLVLSLWKLRFVVMLLVVLMPMVVVLLEQIVIGKKKLKKTKLELVVGVALLLVVSLRLGEMKETVCVNNSPECYARVGGYPVGALKYIKEGNFNVLNHYNWGGYLIWQNSRNKYFIDGRMDNFFVDGKSMLAEFGEIERLDENWREKRWWVTTDLVLMPADWAGNVELLESGEWEKKYGDDTVIVLGKLEWSEDDR